jgi:hypothetical protein
VLLQHGLVAPQGGAAVAATGEVPREVKRDSLTEALNALSYGELYTLLTDQARARLGLIKGYRMVLDIEKATDLPDLQAVAQRFLAQVRDEQGDTGMRELRQLLGLS